MNYKMNHKNRIAALFLNDFEGSIPGHDQDIKNTKKCLEKLGFIVTVHENKTSQETIDLLNHYAKADYSEADCFLCVFSSHGNNADLLASDHKLFDLISIIQEIFTGNKSLNGKPKLFFINACRGDKIMGTLENKIKLNKAKGSSNQSNTPEICDIMIYYSTVNKYLSFGDINGSTFIEAFVEVFNKYGKKEQLMDMVTRINQKIAAIPPFQYIDPDTKSTHNAKQMPTIAECSLTKRVFF